MRTLGSWLGCAAIMSSDAQQDLVISPRLRIAAQEFDWSFARGSGPGGQNVNKVNSKAQLRWNPCTSPSLPFDVRERFLIKFASRLTTTGEVLIESEESRDQPQNIRRCLEKLAEMLALVARPPKPRRPTKPTAGSHRRRLAGKKRRSETKQSRRPPPQD